MKSITAGHSYSLKNHGDIGEPQILNFIHKEPVKPGSKQLKTVRAGTTNEEVLDVLIDRVNFLQAKMPCDENAQALENLISARAIFAARTLRRMAANVEGTNAPAEGDGPAVPAEEQSGTPSPETEQPPATDTTGQA